MLYLDFPATGSSVSTQFSLAGWAVDLGASAGSGISAVHVWAFPTTGGAPIFVGAASLGVARPDVGAYLGSPQFGQSGFVLSGNLPPGTYDVRVSGLSTVINNFNVETWTRITVVVPPSRPVMSVDMPAPNQNVSQTLSIAGWAADLAAPSGTGVDAIHVYGYPAAGGNPIFVGVGTLGAFRPDVGAYFGDARFSSSGYFLQGTLPRGQYYLVVFAHSTVTHTFNQAAVVFINVL
jgi:hypothetical protein